VMMMMMMMDTDAPLPCVQTTIVVFLFRIAPTVSLVDPGNIKLLDPQGALDLFALQQTVARTTPHAQLITLVPEVPTIILLVPFAKMILVFHRIAALLFLTVRRVSRVYKINTSTQHFLSVQLIAAP